MKNKFSLRLLSGVLFAVMLIGLVPLAASAEPTLITSVNVDGLVEPAAGEHPGFGFTVADDAPYTVGEVRWMYLDETESVAYLDPSDVFEGGAAYFASVELLPKSGYVFPDDYTGVDSAAFNGNEALVSVCLCAPSQMILYTANYNVGAEATLITDVNVDGLVLPVAGEHPSFGFTVADDAPYVIESSMWYSYKEGLLTGSDTFEAGEIYYAVINLLPKSGYAFPETFGGLSSVTIDGSAEPIDASYCGINGETLQLFTVDFTAASAGPVLITDVALDCTAPFVGEHPAPVTAADDAPYVVADCGWYDGTTSERMSDGDTFIEGHLYYADVLIAPKYGYVFPDDIDGFDDIVIGGGSAEVDTERSTIENDIGYNVLRVYTVGVTPTERPTVITSVNVDGFADPAEGELPCVFTVPDDAPYTVSRFSWVRNGCGQIEPSDVFEGGGTYYCGIILEPKAGYAFPEKASDLSSLTVNGRDDVLDMRYCRINDGVLELYTKDLSVPHALTAQAALAPTCTAAGREAYYVCSVCGKLFSDAEGENEIAEPTAIPAPGHDYVAAVTAPTCTAQGYTTHVCSRCADSYVDSYVSALGHDYAGVVTAPTCTAQGYTTFTCSRCGDTYQGRFTTALGHDFGADKNAEFCSRCGEANPNYKPPVTVKFEDVPAGAYYEAAVNWAVANGITQGISMTRFGPDNGCTRGQVVTFLWRSAGSPEPKGESNPFSDVKDGDYYYKAVLWAVENGVTAGVSKTSFAPDATCTRGQIVTFLWRASGSPEPKSGGNPFDDVSASDYYYRAVLWAVENGITAGVSKTSFAPNSTCTRAQIVTFLFRATVK